MKKNTSMFRLATLCIVALFVISLCVVFFYSTDVGFCENDERLFGGHALF